MFTHALPSLLIGLLGSSLTRLIHETCDLTMSRPINRDVKRVFKVYEYFRKRKNYKKGTEYKLHSNINKLVVEVTGFSVTTVKRVILEGSMSQSSGQIKFSSSEKPKTIKKKIEIDDFDLGVIIRRKIYQIYTVEKGIPSLRKLRVILKNDGIVDWSI